MKNTRNEYYAYLKEQISIEEVCDKFGIVRKNVGEDYVCSCIYHDDPNPSMHIYTKTKSFYCFECHRSGNVFNILEKKLERGFYESIQWIEETYPWVLEEKPVNSNNQFLKQQKKNGFDIAYGIYKNMHNTEKKHLNEFAEKRGYETEFLMERGIFFVTGKKLHNTYVKKAEQSIEEMELLKQDLLLKPLPLERGHIEVHYDDYYKNNRVIITLRDERSRIVGFVGRGINERTKPKYLFTKNLPKSRILYRLDFVKEQLTRTQTNKQIYIVEGIFDALRLESMGKLAVAVMGSHLVDNQIKLLEDVVDNARQQISLKLFLDTDEAGVKGTVRSIKSIWRSEILNGCYLSVELPISNEKDPDEVFKSNKSEKVASYSAFEFLLLFYMAEEGERLVDIELRTRFEELSVEKRIWVLHNIEDMLTDKMWSKLFDNFDAVVDSVNIEKEKTNEEFAYLMIRQFIKESTDGDEWIRENKKSITKSDSQEAKKYSYRMQTALQIARTSYEREEITLDEATWERIALGADIVFEYLHDSLKKQEHIGIPMISMQVPKKLGVQRRKELCCHEELVQQQYVLNELLTPGQDENFERYIPAVRYTKEKGIYLTGYEYMDFSKEVVSFAYQVDMSVINGTSEIKSGMYRPFYDCWKSYINYIQEGIEKLDGDIVYRVKLDIQGFYDNIRRFVIRDAIYPAIVQAMRSDEGKFECFEQNGDLNQDRAENVVNWILEELYKTSYYDSEEGEIKRKEDYDCGIPQGPNLSSYVANVALFSLDKKVLDIVRRVNAECEEGKINARYARYVDDMIIIASSPKTLMEIRAAIASHLYDLQLNLSPKTEDADGISKEEARDWTLEERGGFGVSSGFDMPEDSVSSLVEEYENYEVTDRRGALKLLQSNLYALLYEGITSDAADFDTLVGVFFQTEEIRYQDIIRFSEMMIYYAAQKEEGLATAFERIWKKGLEKCQSDALFMEQGLDSLVLLEGCCRILKRQKLYRNKEVTETWSETVQKIAKNWKEILKNVNGCIMESEVLRKNRWCIELKMLEIEALLDKDARADIKDRKRQADNEYWCRWKWFLTKNIEGDDIIPEIKEAHNGVLQDFQYCLVRFLKLKEKDDYLELRSKFKNHRSNYGKQTFDKDIIITCFQIWFFGENTNNKENALRVLLNTIPIQHRAEIVNEISPLKEYVFSKKSNKNNIQEFLPVYPGVGYPGIMAVEKKENHVQIVKRVDFELENGMKVLNDDSWNMENASSKGTQRKCYKKNLSKNSNSQNAIEYIQLGEYCYNKDKATSAINCLENICEIYPRLSEEFACVNEKLKNDGVNRKLILSKKNVLIELDIQKKKIHSISVENAYLIPEDVTTNVVAIENGEEKYEVKTVHEDGAIYWISGYLLKDACQIREMKLTSSLMSEEEHNDAEMLEYSINRLCGAFVHQYDYKKSGRKSYQKSVERTIELIKLYLEKEGLRALCLENAKIVNFFIANKMENERIDFCEEGLNCSIWAKNYLSKGYPRLLKLLEEKKIQVQKYQIERRVPKLYSYLADGVYQLSLEDNTFLGLKILSAGLYADSILMHLRMQVLECIEALDTEQRKQFIEEAQKSEEIFPLYELNLDEKVILTIKDDLNDVYKNILERKSAEKSICNITHLGWMVLLAKVCEIEKESGFIIGDDYSRKIHRKEIKEELLKVSKILNSKKKEEDKSELDFPFEKMGNVFTIWTKENVLMILNSLHKIDDYYGIQVIREESAYYTQIVQNKRVLINTETDKMEKKTYFCTYAKRSNNICDVEINLADKTKKIYTLTKIRGNVVGVSTIDKEFGTTLQSWENEELLFEEEKVVGEEKEISKKGEINIQEKSVQENFTSNKQKIDAKEENILNAVNRFHKKEWENRGKTKFFANASRIALFQFQIDSSYRHPDAERCMVRKGVSTDEEMSVEQADMKSLAEESSCAEFRRRKLLEKVMDTCSRFGVEILLLPEYSMRPETVEWMRKKIQDEEYEFSVWAGTYRIPIGYQFTGDENIYLNNRNYWHSAPLPVITRPKTDNKDKVDVLMKKFKKYPAVTLHEDINPTPAYEAEKNFSPIMHQYISDDKKKIKEQLPYFHDARDHVIELICAELFAMASISNYPSFLKESLCAFSRYHNSKILEKEEVFQEYEKNMLEDIQRFGTYTALYQKESKYLRTPILLVPACTTRAVDYYVFGQGFYLSAGINTVFCNSVGTGGRGGSCFIGQGSWDDRNADKNEYLMENTIYHGLKPGIYTQTSKYKDRCALGQREQALLICDISPANEKKQPNAESMLDALSIVAHIPVFEEKVLGKECKNFEKCKYCSKYEKPLMEKEKQTTEEELKMIINHCNSRDTEYKEREHGKKATLLTYDDNLSKVNDVLVAMTDLGKRYHSDLFIRRAEYYGNYYKMYPQAWASPALTDWLYIEINYQEFLDNPGEYRVQMPRRVDEK